MTVIWIVIGVVLVAAVLLTVLEVQNRRRARRLAHLERADPRIADQARHDAEAQAAMTEGLSKAAHQGISGAGGPIG
ncbi:hypothetical protein DEI99_016580 [Curtobacterium sp. MCLR17_036]|uniref:hypothetical protein n=1 Tax=Curtobacterium sp. MCLR17_036 TaxID=2175620 RepID=UPI000DAAB56B|nr:hypothetical protein [Curtobacterium sp. MCLR17_036]WIE64826.1 hypothetical protein DEI99_016580 [Curtobacterium sp. MCLR17_036]